MSSDQPDCSTPLPPAALHGLELFNEGDYFEAHEFLESAWRAEPKPIRGLYQAILQAAVTYLHIQRGNYMGAVKVGGRASVKLEQWPAACCGVDVESLRGDLARVIAALTRLGPRHIRDFDQSLFKPVHYV